MQSTMKTRFGKVRLTKDICVDNTGMKSVMRETGRRATMTFSDGRVVDCGAETIFDHWEGGLWMREGEIHEVAFLTTKGVRVRTGFDAPHKVQYVHHEDFVWVESPIGSENWAMLPSELY